MAPACGGLSGDGGAEGANGIARLPTGLAAMVSAQRLLSGFPRFSQSAGPPVEQVWRPVLSTCR